VPSKCSSLLYHQLKTDAREISEMAEPEHTIERHVSTVEERDEEELGQFGYKQELRRDWGLAHNFGISFSIIVWFSFTLIMAVTNMRSVSHHWYYNTLWIWVEYRRSGRYIHPTAYTRLFLTQ
jgi:hypothetical protein